jgi:hypothetical protein
MAAPAAASAARPPRIFRIPSGAGDETIDLPSTELPSAVKEVVRFPGESR